MAVSTFDLVESFVRRFPLVNISTHFVQFAIIAEFYAKKDLPDYWKAQWMYIDYMRYCQYGECRPVELFYSQFQKREKTEHFENTRESRINDPSWTGPNGTWTLD